VARAVIDGEAELGFVEGPVSNPLLAVEAVGTNQMIIVVPPDHPLTNNRTLSREDLVSANWVLREDGSGTRAVFTERCLGWASIL
jgi:DNA-binding transcriptional LysR family regulator